MSADGAAMYPITDWDDAYANAAHIPDGASYPKRWVERAAAFRERLSGARARLDLAYGAAARNKGMTEAQYSELLAIVGLANETNRLVTALDVPVDERFL